MNTIDFLSLASKLAEISVVCPDLIIFYVLSADITLRRGVVRSTLYELSHKSLMVSKVPLANADLNPLT